MIENTAEPMMTYPQCMRDACGYLYSRFRPYSALASDGVFLLWYSYKSNPNLVDQGIELISHSFTSSSSNVWSGIAA